MAGEAASLWTKVHERIGDALSALVGLYHVTAVDGSTVTIDVDGWPREVMALRGAVIRPDDIALVVFIERDGYAVSAAGMVDDIETGGGGSYTNEMARDAIAAALVAGDNIFITHDDAADTITISAADDAVDSVNGQTGAVVLSTSDIAEGSRLYYTDARVIANTTVAANTAARHTHSNKSVLDAVTAAYTTAMETKLAGIATGAEVNVNADWNAVSGDAQILNKPATFPPSAHTHTAANVTDFQSSVSANTDVAANTAARHSHTNKAVLDATTASFTTADETKLDGINLANYLASADAPELIRDTMATALVAGANITITPNDAGDTITIVATDTNTTDPEVVRDTIATALVAGSNVTITPNDAGDTITISATPGAGVTNLTITRTSTAVTVLSDTGTDAAIPAADATNAGVMTAADKSKLDGIEAGADKTDATNVNAAGAVMLSDTTTTGMGFVIDEDAMTSNLATRVPTQQSVKAYVDAQVSAGSHSHGNLATLNAITAAYTTAEKTKLAGIASGAEVNVQSDWNAGSGDAAILNKPSVPTQAEAEAGTATTGRLFSAQRVAQAIGAHPQVATLAALRFDPAHPSYGAVRGAGVSTATRTANTAAIQLAADDAASQGGTLVLKGEYECDGGLQFQCHVDGRFGVLSFFDQTINPAVLVGDGSTRLQAYTLSLPEIVQAGKVTTGWGTDTGLRFTNVYTSEITIPRVRNFSVGVDMHATGSNGTVYNNVYLGLIHNNKIGIDFNAVSGGWVNECVFIGGQLAIDSAEGTTIAGARHIRMGAAASGNAFNNHIFIKPSIEGNGPEYHLEYGGQYNTILQGRWEASPPKILGLTGSHSLIVEGGYNSQSIVVTGSIADLRIMSRLREKWASSGNVHGLMVLANLSSATHPAVTIMESGSAANFWSSDPETDYAWAWGQQSLKGKAAVDAYPRLQMNAYEGRLYMGPGTQAPTLMMRHGGSGANIGPYLAGAKVWTAGPVVPMNKGPEIHAGPGTPEGSVTASPGSLYMSTTGTIYRKSTGTGNTGWVAMT